MTYDSIRAMAGINEVDREKVNALADSMIKDGWIGAPILVYGESLLTGSHRLAALHEVERRYGADEIDSAPSVLWEDVAADVTEIVEQALAAFESERGWSKDIDTSDIGWLLKGSWVEQYKAEIAEW